MDAYSVHLAMAALVGASFVAVSAYYMHRKPLNQLLELAKTIERDREREDCAAVDGDDSPQHYKKYTDKQRRSLGRRKGNGYYRRSSASLPDVTAISGAADCEERRNRPVVHVDSIPAGLPRLHTLPEGKSAGHSAATKRTGHLIRPTSPKSPVASASASAFESVEGSDEEADMTDHAKLEGTDIHTNGNAVGCFMHQAQIYRTS